MADVKLLTSAGVEVDPNATAHEVRFEDHDNSKSVIFVILRGLSL